MFGVLIRLYQFLWTNFVYWEESQAIFGSKFEGTYSQRMTRVFGKVKKKNNRKYEGVCFMNAE